jgi:ketosteroid isomerase-like protein
VNEAEVVRQLWERISDRDWLAVRELLAPDLRVEWPATGEVFLGPDNFVAVQSRYPEGWSINVLQVIAQGDTVVADVEVPHKGVGTFRVASFCTVRNGLVAQAVEYWVTVGGDEPPDWRAPYRLASGPEELGIS